MKKKIDSNMQQAPSQTPQMIKVQISESGPKQGGGEPVHVK